MSIPDAIAAKSMDEPHGIIYELRKIVGINNIANYVIVSTNVGANDGILNTFVRWDNVYQSVNNKDAYIQFQFKDRYVYATHYCIKGRFGNYYSKQWNLYGSNDAANWNYLSTGTSARSGFCGNGETCENTEWGCYNIANKGAYRYFRIVSYVPSRENNWHLTGNGFEIFGIYSKDGRTGYNPAATPLQTMPPKPTPAQTMPPTPTPAQTMPPTPTPCPKHSVQRCPNRFMFKWNY